MRKAALFNIYNLFLHNKIFLLLIFYSLTNLFFIFSILNYEKAFFFYNYKIINKINSIVLLYAILLVAICFIIKYKSCYIYLTILVLLIILVFAKYYIYSFIILKNNLIVIPFLAKMLSTCCIAIVR